MTSLKKLIDSFKNLKSDAVPQPPRPEAESAEPVIIEDNGRQGYTVEEDEDVGPYANEAKNKHSDPKNIPKDKKNKSFFKDFKKSKDDDPTLKGGKENITINTQATGAVSIIMNSKGVHYGDKHVYNFGPAKNKQSDPSQPSEENIEKDNLITLVMEAKIRPEHEYIDYISKNLGKDWHSFFQTLGYTKGRIETVEIEEARNGLTPVSQARYKLLLDWARNDDDGTLGHLTTYLWNAGERHIVKDLALIYHKNRKL